MKEFCIFFPLLIPVNFASLVLKHLFTIQQVIQFFSNLIYLSTVGTILVLSRENVRPFPSLLDFFWDVANYLLVPH